MHPVEYVSTSPAFVRGLNGTKRKFAEHSCVSVPLTVIENDVWFGHGVFVKAGVTIHTGAVVGMNSVVLRDIGPYEIWAGDPAVKIRDRFSDNLKNRLLDSGWWELDDEKLMHYAQYFNNPEKFVEQIEYR